jgi:pimeloyl-ACP methyl ester carboxylesterase
LLSTFEGALVSRLDGAAAAPPVCDAVIATTQKRSLMLGFATFVAAYVLVMLGVFVAQRRLIYPVRGSGATPAVPGATLERLAAPGGGTVHTLYAPARGGAPTLVHFHGNGEELADQGELLTLFGAHGLGVLAVEYPGYGLSRGGQPSERSLYEAAEVALRDLRENKGIPRERTVLSGQSLGSGVAVEMASRGHGARVLLFAPYTSIADVANVYLPFLPNRWLVRDRFDNAAKAPRVTVPVLVVHGTDDEVIPFELGERLSGMFPNARLVKLDRARHNDLFLRGGDALAGEIETFCRRE